MLTIVPSSSSEDFFVGIGGGSALTSDPLEKHSVLRKSSKSCLPPSAQYMVPGVECLSVGV